MTFGRTLIITCGLAAMASPAFAQHWGHERTPHDGACFYKDADFRGEYFCVPAGDKVGSLANGMNDQISSIRIFGRTEVNVYRDRNLSGRHARFEHDVHNLRNQDWNDTISSLQVLAIRGGGDHEKNEMTLPRAQEIVRRAYLNVFKREHDYPGANGYVNRVMKDHWTQSDLEQELRKVLAQDAHKRK